MKYFKSILLSVCICFSYANFTFAEFSISDLAGTWYGHSIETYAEEQWVYYTVTCDSQGNCTIHDTSSLYGEGEGPSYATMHISSDGEITIDGFSSDIFHCYMSLDKNSFAFVNTVDDSPGYALGVYVKGGGSFSQSDVQGTWYGHILTTGLDDEKWEYCTLNFDIQGNFTGTCTDPDGTDSVSGKIDIAANGIISMDGNSALHGAMSLDKNLLALTDTYSESPSEYALGVYVKGGGSFSQSDIQGTWYGFALTSGSSDEKWEYFTLTCDSQGNCTGPCTDPNGTDQVSPKVNISSSGIMSIEGNSAVHGVMSLDKNFLTLTDTYSETSGEYALGVYLKGSDTGDEKPKEMSHLLQLLLDE